MKKEQQDLAWACLTKETRDEIRKEYNHRLGWSWDSVKDAFLENLFGHHNLTSDTEPEEMLMALRKDVQEQYESYQEIVRWSNDGPKGHKDRIRGKEVMSVLEELFDDKCLPDKEPSVQVEPKFKVGDEVWYGVNKCTINNIKGNVAYIVYNNGASWEKISQLRPYIEPNYRFDIGDKVKFSNGKIKIVRNRYASPYDEFAHYSVVTIKGQSPINVIESDLEPYIEPETKDNMEKNRCEKCGANAQQCADSPCQEYPLKEKELNLCELLKDCEREEFYLLDCGSATLDGVQINNARGDSITFLSFHSTNFDSGAIIINPNGKRKVYGSVILYPSRALYEKYPLDAYSAWMEWKEERKPKRWRTEKGEEYWRLDSAFQSIKTLENNDSSDEKLYECCNYFRTESEAKEMAVKIKELLLNGR